MPPPIEPRSGVQAHFDYALNGILETDDQWQVRRCNQAGLSILQRSVKEMQSQTLDRFLQAHGGPDVLSHFELLQEQGICHSVLSLPSPSRGLQWLEWSSIQADDRLYIHFFEDVTLQHEASRAQEAARAAAENANRAKSTFLANVSHELRTPLNGMLGLAQLCLMDELPSQTRQHLEKMVRSGQTLLRMLNDLLDFSRIESGKMSYERAPFDLWELLEELTTTVAHLALGKELEIAFLLEPGVPRWLVGDRLRLHQILTNLLGNAVKFTSEGEVALEIGWVAEHGSRELRFAVKDTGPGIDKATLARLFEPFTQADNNTAHRFGGTGLGLAISRQMARGMGGELRATSTPGQGSCFTVQLPLSPDPNVPTADRQAWDWVGVTAHRPLTRRALHQVVHALGGKAIDVPAHGPAAVPVSARIVDLAGEAESTWTEPSPVQGPTLLLTDARSAAHWGLTLARQQMLRVATRPLTPLGLLHALDPTQSVSTPPPEWDVPQEFQGARIAVAEDMPINRDVIVGLLERAGIEVLLAHDGADLLDLLNHADPAPELVLMDVHMPVMDGMSATRALRASGQTLPVVALSAGALDTEQAECMAAGMNDFLSKPVDPDALWGMLTRWLPPRRPRASPQSHACTDTMTPARDLSRWQAAGIDVDDALPRFLGRTDVLERALEQLLDQHASAPDTLATMLIEGPYEMALKVAHALKGSAATVGAHQLVRCCQLLETGLQQHPPPPLQGKLEELAAELGRLGQARRPAAG